MDKVLFSHLYVNRDTRKLKGISNTKPNKKKKLITIGYIIKYDIIHFGSSLIFRRCDAGKSPKRMKLNINTTTKKENSSAENQSKIKLSLGRMLTRK